MRSRTSGLFAGGLLFLALKFVEVGVETVQTPIPVAPKALHPFRHLLQGLGFQAAGTPLGSRYGK